MQGHVRFKKAGIIANKELAAHLMPYGYHPVTFTPGVRKHAINDTTFTLAVVKFSIKYTSLKKTNNLLDDLKNKYKLSTN